MRFFFLLVSLILFGSKSALSISSTRLVTDKAMVVSAREEAVNTARFHHQWIPDEITFEPIFFQPILESLKKKKYIINEKNTPLLG